MIKKVAVINDISGFGKCSLATSISILSVMGVQPCALPTAVLSNQTGYKNYYSYDFSKHMHNFADIWEKNKAEFDGIYSGYVANAEQVDFISDFIDRFKKPHTKVIVDPVLGDNGKIYDTCTADTCNKMRELVKKADIITPNLTELCILSGQDYYELEKMADSKNYLETISTLAQGVSKNTDANVIVTGIKKGSYILSGVFTQDETYFAKSMQIGGSFSGTGDIFASIICASAIKNINIKSAVDTAVAFIEKAVADTTKEKYDRNDGINFEKFLYTLALEDKINE